MWLSIESPNRESKFAVFCLCVLFCLYRQLKRHTAWAAQKVLQVYVPVDGSSSLLSLSTTGTGSASLECHTRGLEHGDLHSLIAGRWVPDCAICSPCSDTARGGQVWAPCIFPRLGASISPGMEELGHRASSSCFSTSIALELLT